MDFLLFLVLFFFSLKLGPPGFSNETLLFCFGNLFLSAKNIFFKWSKLAALKKNIWNGEKPETKRITQFQEERKLP